MPCVPGPCFLSLKFYKKPSLYTHIYLGTWIWAVKNLGFCLLGVRSSWITQWQKVCTDIPTVNTPNTPKFIWPICFIWNIFLSCHHVCCPWLKLIRTLKNKVKSKMILYVQCHGAWVRNTYHNVAESFLCNATINT